MGDIADWLVIGGLIAATVATLLGFLLMLWKPALEDVVLTTIFGATMLALVGVALDLAA